VIRGGGVGVCTFARESLARQRLPRATKCPGTRGFHGGLDTVFFSHVRAVLELSSGRRPMCVCLWGGGE